MSIQQTAYVIAATNVPQGRFAEAEFKESEVQFAARHLSKQEPGVVFTVFRVRPGEGAHAVVSFLNGECRFTTCAG